MTQLRTVKEFLELLDQGKIVDVEDSELGTFASIVKIGKNKYSIMDGADRTVDKKGLIRYLIREGFAKVEFTVLE